MSTLSNITDFLSGGFMKEVKEILDGVITNKEELAEVELKVKQLEADTLVKLKTMQIDDTKSAREADVKKQESKNASWLAKNIPYVIALSVTLGTVTTWFIDVSDRADVSANAAFTLVLGFFFGSAVKEYNKSVGKNQK